MDLDEVLYPWLGALRHWLHAHRGRSLASLPVPQAWVFHESWGFDSFGAMVRESVAGHEAGVVYHWGDPYEGAAETLEHLRAAGHSVHLVTARAGFAGAGVEDTTRAWLARHGIPFDSLHFTSEKGALGLDVLVDDYPGNLVAAEGSGAVGVLVDQPHNRGEGRFRRVRALREVPGVVSDVTSHRARSVGRYAPAPA